MMLPTAELDRLQAHPRIVRLLRSLAEHPPVAGLAVAGMPAGSPGMEVPGGRVDPYDTIAFDKTGKTQVFATHR